MDPQPYAPSPFTTPPPPAGKKKPFTAIIIVFVVIIALALVGGGTYALVSSTAATEKAALEAKITKLQADLKKVTDDNTKNSAAAQTVAGQTIMTVSEMDLKLKYQDTLKGLTYVYGTQKTDQGDLSVVQFSSQAILAALYAVPDGGGQKWYIGNLLSAYFVDNRADAPTEYEKAHLIKDFGDKRLIELVPATGPYAEKGFETYNTTYNTQHALLLDVLKKAELIKSK